MVVKLHLHHHMRGSRGPQVGGNMCQWYLVRKAGGEIWQYGCGYRVQHIQYQRWHSHTREPSGVKTAGWSGVASYRWEDAGLVMWTEGTSWILVAEFWGMGAELVLGSGFWFMEKMWVKTDSLRCESHSYHHVDECKAAERDRNRYLELMKDGLDDGKILQTAIAGNSV